MEGGMLREELIFVGTCDIAGHVRGKGFPARELAARKKQGIGWTHSNLMQTAFGVILDTPFGTGGDSWSFRTWTPRPASISRTARRLNISSWAISATPTARLGSAARAIPPPRLAALDAAVGLRLMAAFEQEFVYTGISTAMATPIA